MINSHTGTPDTPPSSLASVTLHQRPYDHPDAVLLVNALFEDQVDRYGYADPAEADPAHYAPPNGLFLVAYSGTVPVACGGYRTYDAGSKTIEIKKMYTRPQARGSGLGRRILAELERHAAAAGFIRSILETGVRNTAALALYTSTGYRPHPRYATDYRDPKINRAFIKALCSEI